MAAHLMLGLFVVLCLHVDTEGALFSNCDSNRKYGQGYDDPELSCDINSTATVRWTVVNEAGATLYLGTCYGPGNCTTPYNSTDLELRHNGSQTFITLYNISSRFSGELTCQETLTNGSVLADTCQLKLAQAEAAPDSDEASLLGLSIGAVAGIIALVGAVVITVLICNGECRRVQAYHRRIKLSGNDRSGREAMTFGTSTRSSGIRNKVDQAKGIKRNKERHSSISSLQRGCSGREDMTVGTSTRSTVIRNKVDQAIDINIKPHSGYSDGPFSELEMCVEYIGIEQFQRYCRDSDSVAVCTLTKSSSTGTEWDPDKGNSSQDIEYSGGSCCTSTSFSDRSASRASSEGTSRFHCQRTTPKTSLSEKEYDGDTSPSVQCNDCQEQENLQSERKVSSPAEPFTTTDWQASSTFSAVGGILRKCFSDAILTVPPFAVKEDISVVIYTAVCTDLDLIRRVLKLPDTDDIVSPMAEYSTDPPGFHFTKHVCIQMPHFLQPDFDPSLLQVYHVTKDPHGQVNKTPLDVLFGKTVVGDNEKILSSKSTNGSQPLEALSRPNDTDASSLHPREMSIYGEVTEDGKIYIYTDRFCGFVCTYCNKKEKKSLQLFAMLQGSYDWAPQTFPLINVSLYIWDRRITVADFTQMHGFEPSKDKMLLNRLDVITGTRLCARLRYVAADGFRFSLDNKGQPLTPVETCFDLPQRLCCGKCQSKGKTPLPMKYSWELRPQPGVTTPSCVSVSVDISHVAADRSPGWVSCSAEEKVTCTSFRVTDFRGTPNEGIRKVDMSLLRRHLPSLTALQREEVKTALIQSTVHESSNRNVNERELSAQPDESLMPRVSNLQQMQTPGQACIQTHGQDGADARPRMRNGKQRKPESTLSFGSSNETRSQTPESSLQNGYVVQHPDNTSCSYGNQDHAAQDGMNSYLRQHQNEFENGNRNTRVSPENDPNTGCTNAQNGFAAVHSKLNRHQIQSISLTNGTDVSHRVNRPRDQQPFRADTHSGRGRIQQNCKPQRSEIKNPKSLDRGINRLINHSSQMDDGFQNGDENTNAKKIDEGFESDDEEEDTEIKRPINSEKTADFFEVEQMDFNDSFLLVENASSCDSGDDDCLSINNPSVSI